MIIIKLILFDNFTSQSKGQPNWPTQTGTTWNNEADVVVMLRWCLVRSNKELSIDHVTLRILVRTYLLIDLRIKIENIKPLSRVYSRCNRRLSRCRWNQHFSPCYPYPSHYCPLAHPHSITRTRSSEIWTKCRYKISVLLVTQTQLRRHKLNWHVDNLQEYQDEPI